MIHTSAQNHLTPFTIFHFLNFNLLKTSEFVYDFFYRNFLFFLRTNSSVAYNNLWRQHQVTAVKLKSSSSIYLFLKSIEKVPHDVIMSSPIRRRATSCATKERRLFVDLIKQDSTEKLIPNTQSAYWILKRAFNFTTSFQSSLDKSRCMSIHSEK